MNVTIAPSALQGTVRAIPSKSQAHRLLLCAALADGPTELICSGTSEDIEATVRCLTGLGAGIRRENGRFWVTPLDRAHPVSQAPLACGESGSTLRFLLPVVCALGTGGAFLPQGRLPQRPLSPLYEELTAHGCTLSKPGSVPFSCGGQLQSGRYTLAADVSSQYVSGLLFALPLLAGDSELTLTGQVESRPYIDMTLHALKAFGIAVRETGSGFSIPGGQRYRSPGTVNVEGDWSNAAFWLCAGAIGEHPVTVTNLTTASLQGDRACLALLERFGARVKRSDDSVTVSGGDLRGLELDAKDVPDLVPVFALVAAAAEGVTVIRNAGRLRLKESDRLKAVAETFTALGAAVSEQPDGLVIRGAHPLSGGVVSSWGDHRIAMTAAIAAQCAGGPVTITGAEAVNKSYPDFYTHFRRLGGSVTEEATWHPSSETI